MGDDNVATIGGIELAAVNTATAHLLGFFKEDPEGWFCQVEGKFIIAGIISSKTKASYVMASLDMAMDRLVRHISYDGEDPYAEVKAVLIESCKKDRRQRISELLAAPILGAETPHLAARIEGLLKDVTATDIGWEVFLRALPEWASRAICVHAADKSLCELAKEVGVLFVRDGSSIAEPQQGIFAAVAPSPQTSSAASPPVVNAASRPPPRGGVRPHSSGARSPRFVTLPAPRQRQGGRDMELHSICQFHKQFGRDARNCISPCLMGNSGGWR